MSRKIMSYEPFIAEISLFGGNFAPKGWAFCEGQILKIQEHTALFSLIGTTYGGDGRETFALPDLRGRVPVHPNAHGYYAEGITLGAKVNKKPVVVKTGDDQVSETLVPHLGVSYIIALEGIFPPRS